MGRANVTLVLFHFAQITAILKLRINRDHGQDHTINSYLLPYLSLSHFAANSIPLTSAPAVTKET